MINPAEQKKLESKIAEAIEKGLTEFSFAGFGTVDLPESLKQLPNLKKLTIECYGKIPSWVADIESLEYLKLDELDIGDFAQKVHRLKNLKYLQMSYCDLNELPETLSELKNLEYLNIDGAEFKDPLPEWILRLQKLNSISIVHSRIQDMDKTFEILSRLPSLKYLHITRLFYMEDEREDILPDSLGKLENLETLDLSGWMGLKQIPDSIGNLKKLKKLNLSEECTELEKLPDIICTLPLEELNVTECSSLSELPKDFDKIDTLKSLIICSCPIKSVSLSEKQLKNLETLWIDFPFPDMGKCINLKKLGYFSQRVGTDYQNKRSGIVFGTKGEAMLPPAGLKKLKHLSLQGGTIKDTSFLSELTSLEYLSLSCDMAALPYDIGKLKNLKTLDMWGAESLKQLPYSFGDLELLEEIDWRFCGIEKVPVSVKNLKNLRTINIEGARGMQVFPANWYMAENLECISITDCFGLREMPDGISNLKNLKDFSIWFSVNLKRLPKDLCKLEKLESLTLSRLPKLMKLPEGWKDLRSLQQMRLINIGISVDKLPVGFFNISNLLFLEYGSETMKELPVSFGEFPSLKKLKLSWCHKLEKIPVNLAQKSKIQEIEFSCCDFASLPSGLEEMKGLSYSVYQCSKLMDRQRVVN